MILLRLPPLRERGDDVLVLADHFLRRFRAKYGKSIERVDPRSHELLLRYPWPGNVRELSHVIERAVLWSRGPDLDIEHLALEMPADARRWGGEPTHGRRDRVRRGWIWSSGRGRSSSRRSARATAIRPGRPAAGISGTH